MKGDKRIFFRQFLSVLLLFFLKRLQFTCLDGFILFKQDFYRIFILKRSVYVIREFKYQLPGIVTDNLIDGISRFHGRIRSQNFTFISREGKILLLHLMGIQFFHPVCHIGNDAVRLGGNR